MMVQRNPLCLSLTDLIHLTQTLILNKRSSGSRITTAATPTYLWGNCMVSYVRTRPILVIPVLCIECLSVSDFVKRLSLPRRNLYITNHMIHLL